MVLKNLVRMCYSMYQFYYKLFNERYTLIIHSKERKKNKFLKLLYVHQNVIKLNSAGEAIGAKAERTASNK